VVNSQSSYFLLLEFIVLKMKTLTEKELLFLCHLLLQASEFIGRLKEFGTVK
jgi:hypothetical protein